MNNKLLNIYLSEAVRGNAEASYKAGKLMEMQGTFNELAVQKRYIDAAKGGYTPAQKELAVLGLCKKLITDQATAFNIQYYNDYNAAIMWLKRAASNGDAECSIVIAAIERDGTKAIDEARATVEDYYSKVLSTSSVLLPYLTLYEIVFRYINPFDASKKELKIA